ncbi:MAG: hypothetical protein ACOYM3_17230, partial [Terrimicrobiaceae bacterium]
MAGYWVSAQNEVQIHPIHDAQFVFAIEAQECSSFSIEVKLPYSDSIEPDKVSIIGKLFENKSWLFHIWDVGVRFAGGICWRFFHGVFVFGLIVLCVSGLVLMGFLFRSGPALFGY